MISDIFIEVKINNKCVDTLPSITVDLIIVAIRADNIIRKSNLKRKSSVCLFINWLCLLVAFTAMQAFDV